jgi:GTP-binding protein
MKPQPKDVGRRGLKGAGEPKDLPVVSLVGRPNVGKSSLFNRLVGGRPALVEDTPGVTRDRRYGVCEWGNFKFRVVDTGGLDPSAEGILGAMRGQTMRAVDEAHVLVFVVDAQEGVSPVDADVAKVLRKTGKPVLVAANKIDTSARDLLLSEAYQLGYGEVFPLSASHGRGVRELLDAVVERLVAAAPQAAQAATEVEAEAPIRLAFVGKPNAGKSSLVNRLLGEDRVLVHDQPGTTRDPIDTPFSAGGQDFILVDTAGLRRRRSIDTMTEAVSAKMARDQLARADVVALVIDGNVGATAEDAKLASFIEESGRATMVILNKSDLIRRAEFDEQVKASKATLEFMAHAPFLSTSAMTGRGVAAIAKTAVKAFAEWSRRVPTSDLNKTFEAIVAHRLPPSGPAGRHVKLYYITQSAIRPPTFFVSCNNPKAVAQPYRRYLVNQLRKVYGFEGAPLRLALREHQSKRKAQARPRD